MSCDLLDIVKESQNLKQIYKSALRTGDLVILETCNSVYMIRVLDNGQYTVSGGWFDKNKFASVKVSIRGCTWGGSVIKTDIVAACGLHLEFGNKVVTSKIKKILHVPGYLEN
jgi:hypothetical protein